MLLSLIIKLVKLRHVFKCDLFNQNTTKYDEQRIPHTGLKWQTIPYGVIQVIVLEKKNGCLKPNTSFPLRKNIFIFYFLQLLCPQLIETLGILHIYNCHEKKNKPPPSLILNLYQDQFKISLKNKKLSFLQPFLQINANTFKHTYIQTNILLLQYIEFFIKNGNG